jgi:hypothetical protein
VAPTAVELHGCCARVSLDMKRRSSANIPYVARAGSAGTKSGAGGGRAGTTRGSRARPTPARFRDQLGLGDEANSEIADLYATGSSARCGVAVGVYFANFQRQRGPADP